MQNQQDSNYDDALEQAARAIQNTVVPPSPSDEVLTGVSLAVESALSHPQPRISMQRTITMKSLTGLTAAAATLLFIGGTAVWLLTTGGGTNVALADVANVLNKLQSATFTRTTTEKGKAPIITKNMYLEPDRFRMESSRDMVMIYGKSRMLTLVPEKKSAVILKLENVPEERVEKNWLEDVYQNIRMALGGAKNNIKELGQRQIDGKDAVGFQLRVEDNEMTVWADPETAFPIRVESTTGIVEPKFHHILTNFRYNVELDESLFSLEPPEDYVVQDVAMDASKPRESDFVELLRVYAAKQEDGRFPPTLAAGQMEKGVISDIQDRIDEKFGDWRKDPKLREKVSQSEEFKALMELGIKLGRGLGFLHELAADVEWHYAGKGVKEGTPDRPIFWYRPAGSENYHVIYADLSTDEVAVDALNGFPDVSEQAE